MKCEEEIYRKEVQNRREQNQREKKSKKLKAWKESVSMFLESSNCTLEPRSTKNDTSLTTTEKYSCLRKPNDLLHYSQVLKERHEGKERMKKSVRKTVIQISVII